MEVSTTVARDYWLSSITHSTRNRRPQDSASDTKSKLQRWFAPCGIAIGARVPSARFRPPRLRTVSRSSR